MLLSLLPVKRYLVLLPGFALCAGECTNHEKISYTEMFKPLKFLTRTWPTFRAHITSLAVALSLNSTWRVPREVSRYGGVSYGLLFSVAMVTVGLPIILLQLAVGQLSQQDAIGVWRAVPAFKGVGYLRLATSFLMSILTLVYMALTITHFIYTLNNGNPLSDCFELEEIIEIPDAYVNDTSCVIENLVMTFKDVPEYYMAMGLVIMVLGIAFPFLLFSPTKYLKKFFYVLGPLVLLLMITAVSTLGNKTDFIAFYDSTDWQNFLEPDIWFRSVSQALVTSQVAGGYLISSADSIYQNTNVKWTSFIFVSINVLACWLSMLVWTSVHGRTEYSDLPIAGLIQTYKMAAERHLGERWPLLIFAMLISSCVITMLTLLYPIYDRFRRVGGHKWIYMTLTSSCVAAAVAVGILGVGTSALTLLEDISLPLLVCVATVLEVLGLVFIYGSRTIRDDIQFLTGSHLSKVWAVSWYLVPVFILSPTLWWSSIQCIELSWLEPPWGLEAMVVSTGLALMVFIGIAVAAVLNQDQYDICSKLKCSVKPSRHWGPRDPITHYYWLASRDEANRGNIPTTRFQRRQLGQLVSPSILTISNTDPPQNITIDKDVKRANSDDLIYTIYRREYLEKNLDYFREKKNRSKSLDFINNVRWKKRESIETIIGSNTEYDSLGSINDFIAIVTHEFGENKVLKM